MQVILDIPENRFEAFINFIKSLDYVEMKDMDNIVHHKAYDVSQIRKVYKNAYEPWTEEADWKLEQFFCKGLSVEELSKLFGRNKGAIESPIKKLGLNDKPRPKNFPT